VGTQPDVDGRSATADFCREIERYLCQKNDGHLIRIAGPSFDLVSGWAARGVPIKVAFRGIDRYFERYYAKGPRRRPVRIDFCEADVLDVFDEWVRATGVTAPSNAGAVDGDAGASVRHGPSLPAHLARVLRRLTSARASGVLDDAFDDLLDRVGREFDAARSVRGAKRQALLDRLAALDRELLDMTRARLDARTLDDLVAEAEAELAAFRAGMTTEAFARAREAAIDRLVRERAGLPMVRLT
jgi:hypothetical protein